MNRKVLGAAIAVVALIGIIVLVTALNHHSTQQKWDAATKPSTSTSSGSSSSSSHGSMPTSSSASTLPSASDSTPESASTTRQVKIENMAFGPDILTVKKGTTVTWTNNDSVAHTVTSEGATGPKSELFGKDKTYSYTFDTVGNYAYFCQPHPSMKAKIIVIE
jgi:plastocyanin